MRSLWITTFLLVSGTAPGQDFWQKISPKLVAVVGVYQGALFGHNGRTVFRSTDNGVSWDSLYYSLANIQNYTVGKNGIHVIGTSSAGMFRSTDGGVTWTATNSGLITSGVMRWPIFAPSGDLFVGTNNAGVFRSTNGGDSWTSVSSGLGSPNIGALAIDSAGNLFAGTALSTGNGIYKSTDNGNSWTATNWTSGIGVWSMSVSPSGNILVGTTTNGIYRSTDNGATWVQTGAAGLRVFNAPFVFPKEGIAFVCLDTVGVFRSTDDGATWHALNSGLTAPAVPSVRYFGVVYANGYLFASSLDGVFRSSQPVTSIAERNVRIEGYVLEQNFPNPFNPSTVISFRLPVGGSVTLKVFDLLGQEVATLVDEPKPPGTYEVNFDAKNLASGIYLYQLRAGEKVETKSMVLIK